MLRKIVQLLLLLSIFSLPTFADGMNKDTTTKYYQRVSFNRAIKNSSLHKNFLIMNTIDKNVLTGKFNPRSDTAYVEATLGLANRKGLFVRKECYAAFKKMHEAAKNDGVSLVIVSATRNFYYQKGIWERKWNGDRMVEGMNLAKEVPDPVERAKIILRYSAMPGTSRHHWGTDIDLNSVNNSYFETTKGKKVYQWLKEHASRFGFCQTYTAKNDQRPGGYEEEKWHWSYLPSAKNFLKQYEQKINYSDISGFPGAEAAKELNVIKEYVLGINPACK